MIEGKLGAVQAQVEDLERQLEATRAQISDQESELKQVVNARARLDLAMHPSSHRPPPIPQDAIKGVRPTPPQSAAE